MTSRNVVLTAAFLALAAGGTAACDTASGDNVDSDYDYSDDGGSSSGDVGSDSPPTVYRTPTARASPTPAVGRTAKPKSSPTPAPTVETVTVDDDTVDGTVVGESEDLVFYCADEDGEVVDEEYCADDGDGGTYFLWHSSSYPRGLPTGTMLDGGDYIATDDRQARTALKLPAAGRVANGTIKTNVVGRSSGSSSAMGGDSAGG